MGAPTLGADLCGQQKGQLKGLEDEYGDVMSGIPLKTNLVSHTLTVGTAQPLKLAPYRVPQVYQEWMEELVKMMEDGVIKELRIGRGAPVVLVEKKDGLLRFCVDYRKLNALTSQDAYPMARVDEMLDQLGGAKYLTTLGLARGYWQVPMDEDAKELTAFMTPFGLYQFKVMPFGLSGAPATFQKLMDGVVHGIAWFTAAYICITW